MRVILKTGGKTIDEIIEDSKRDPQQMDLNKVQAEIVKAYLDAFDGVHAAVTDDEPHHFLIGWDGDFYNVARVKEALYLMNQDPMFGLYVDDREGFEKDWMNGEFSCDAGISFRASDFIIDTETPKEKYKRLRREYPSAKIIYEVEGHENEGVLTPDIINCHIKEYVLQDGVYLFKDMARTYVDALTYNCTENELKKATEDAWEIVKGLKWQLGIFLRMKAEE